MPGVEPSFKRAQLCPSGYLSELIPFHADRLMGEGIKLNARSNNTIYFDLFEKSSPNFNALITGSSGQGKSMIANKLIKENLAQSAKGMILDLGNSFKKNVMFHDGVIFSEKINPLQFNNPMYLKEFVKAVLGGGLSRKEEGKLYEVIKSFDLRNLGMDGFILRLEKEFEDIRYYFSEFEMFFTDETLELNDLSYCDLTNYPESFKSPLMIYLIEYFKQLQGQKIFVFDECWGLLKNNADYVAECFRTFRKHDASAIAISQNMDDFSKTQLGRVIIQNTYYKFLFAQHLRDSEYLTDYQKELLASVHSEKGKFSEFLLVNEDFQKVCRFHSSPLEYELFHSSKDELIHFDHYMEENGKYLSFKEAIINFTKIKYPRWEL